MAIDWLKAAKITAADAQATKGEIDTSADDWCAPTENAPIAELRLHLLWYARVKMSLSKDDTVAIVSLFDTECKYKFAYKRDTIVARAATMTGVADRKPKLPTDFPKDCPCLSVLGWEGGRGVHWSVWNDKKWQKFLLDNGYVTDPDPAGTFAMLWNPEIAKVAQPNPYAYAIMEEAIMRRSGGDSSALRYVAIGGNQINVRWSRPPIGIGTADTGRPDDWQALFNYYTLAFKLESVLQWPVRFMKTMNSIAVPKVGAANGDFMSWLVKQTGSGKLDNGMPIVQAYYMGEGPWTNNGYKAHYNNALAAYNAAGL